MKGGDGMEGRKGKDALESDLMVCKDNSDYNICIRKFFAKNECKKKKNEIINHIDCLSKFSYNIYPPYTKSFPQDDVKRVFKSVVEFTLKGETGYPGGNGGQEGCGGYGGYGGKKIIIEKNREKETIEFINDTSKGPRGNRGNAGKPGVGGLSGNRVIMQFELSYEKGTFSWDDYIPVDKENLITNSIEKSQNQAANGRVHSFCKDSGQNSSKVKIDFYERETEYIKYLMEVCKAFEKIEIFNKNFAKNLIEENYHQAEMQNLIERVKYFDNPEYHFLLDSLKIELNDLNNKKEQPKKEKLVIRYILAAISKILSRYKTAKKTVFVLDLEKYLEKTIDRISEWKSLAKINVRYEYKKDYENNLKKKIDDACKLIDRLFQDIESNEKEISVSIVGTLTEIANMKKKVQNEDSNLIKAMNELKQNISVKLIFSSLKIGNSLLANMGPKGALMASILKIGLDIGGNLAVPEKKTENENNFEKIDEAINEYHEEKKTRLIQKIENEVKLIEKQNSLTHSTRKLLETRIDELPESQKKYEIKLKYVELESSNPKKKLSKINEVKQKIKEFLPEKAKLSLQTANLIAEFSELKEISEEEISILDEEIKKNSKRFQSLHEIENKINDFQTEMLNDINKELNTLKEGIKGNSMSNVHFINWETKNILVKLKNEATFLMKEFGTKTLLFSIINRIENAIETIKNIYENIENFKDKIEFTNFITMIQNDIIIGVPKEYQKDVNDLEKSILTNIILESYEEAMKAFNYWFFPFSYHHFNNSITNLENGNNSNIDDLIQNHETTLKSALQIVKSSKIELKPEISNYIHEFSFDRTSPFYVWEFKNYSLEIKNLFKGEIVTFYADPNFNEYDAIKFNNLQLLIEVNSSSINKTLNSLLENFYIDISHSGVSNFRFKNKSCVINHPGPKLLLRFQYGPKAAENANLSYKELSKSKPILSPYTFWDICIRPVTSKYKIYHEDLNLLLKNASEIKIMLLGKGEYIANDLILNEENMNCIKTRYLF